MILPLSNLPPQAVSAAIWALSRPDAESNATRYYCGWITHPTTGQHALTLTPGDTQPIHPQADTAIAQFVGALRPIVGDTEADALHALLHWHKGGRVDVLQALPPTLAAHLLTPEQAQAAGWYPEPEALP